MMSDGEYNDDVDHDNDDQCQHHDDDHNAEGRMSTSEPEERDLDAPSPSQEYTGRVVRLHFSCHAELPLGSFLRVTGSTLWAPGSAANDPSDAAPAVGRTESAAFPVNEDQDVSQSSTTGPAAAAHGQPGAQSLYASSVEMVTTPETYPVWTTRKPVIVVIHHGKKSVQHHYYRYLVVSPGGATNVAAVNASLMNASGVVGAVDDMDVVDEEEETPVVSTSNEATGSTVVMQWEDPFGTLQDSVTNRPYSSASLTSSVAPGHISKRNYRNLPYRTLDIDVKTGQPVVVVQDAVAVGEAGAGAAASASHAGAAGNSSSSVRLDRWNMPDDASFRPYLIREAIHEENRRKLLSRLSDVTDVSTEEADGEELAQEGGGGAGAAAMEESSPAAAAAVESSSAEMMEAVPPAAGSASAGGLSSGAGTPPTPSIPSNCRIFFVCFHLPVVVVQNQSSGQWRASWSESILAKTEGSQILSAYEAYWVGTVTTHPPLQTEEDKVAVRTILEEMNCIPIFLDPAVRQQHYYGFCKQVLWPAFHNIDLLDLSTCGWLTRKKAPGAGPGAAAPSDWDQGRLDDWWNCYIQVNAEFCRFMAGYARQGDIVWIHDYHLSLLPQQLTTWELEKLGYRATRKVFFLHIPFPTSQIFRELECGEKILQGMLHADVVGFHAFDHARHFLNAAKRILGLNYESIVGGLIGLSFHGNTVLVSMSNVSIEPRMVDAALLLPSVQAGKEQLKGKHNQRIIIGAVDIGQRLSGTSLKLLAYERLLQDYPAWQSRVVMVQRILLPGGRQTDEAVTTRELRTLVKRIQDKFGTAVIDYQEVSGTTMPLDQRLAIWKASDVLMNTPIREGLNHWPMEYIYAHKEPETPGVVIASEFSAISSILNGALRVNPFDIQMTVTTIDKALSMQYPEREGRRYRDIEFVSGCPPDKWVKNVLRDLQDVTMHQRRHNNNNAAGSNGNSENNSQVSTPVHTPGGSKPRAKELVDSTASFLAREANLAFAHLNFKALKTSYDNSGTRVIVLDFNGTIVLKEPPGKYLKREILGTSGNKPPPEVLEALTLLTRDPKNTVYVVSGDSSENVMSALGHIPGIGLAVSNGARFSPPLRPGETSRRWLTFDLGVDWDAVKRVALPVLSKYTARSNGSFVKLTSFSIGWSYYSCDPEWGSLQAAHLVLELENELRAFDVRFVTLKGIVEIVPRKLNKGLIVKKVLRDTHNRAAAAVAAGTGSTMAAPGVDFVLCFGDDISDEKMFTSVFTFLAEMDCDRDSTGVGAAAAAIKDAGPPVLNDDGTLEEVDDFDDPAATAAVSDAMVEEAGGGGGEDTRDHRDHPLYAWTVAVGKKQSHASTYVNDAQEVANALVLLAKGEIPMGGVPIWGRESVSHLFV